MRTDEALTVQDMHDSMRAEIERLQAAVNLLRDALSWFDAHEFGYTPQWVADARNAIEQLAQPKEG